VKREGTLAGLGAVAFGILAFVAMMVGNGPGGNYSTKSVADFLAKGHRPAVIVSLYLMLIATVGLLLVVRRLREATIGTRGTLVWGFGVAAVAAWLAGYILAMSPALSLAYSGGHLKTLSGPLTYSISEAGWAMAYGAGGALLGCALVTFAWGAVAVPAWVRWSTAVAGVAALLGVAWFPFFLVYLWAIVLGVWQLTAARSEAPMQAAATTT
jgi:hypothetical protein